MTSVSVRNLVEFVLRQGDLQVGAAGVARTLDGIKAHQAIQKANIQQVNASDTLWMNPSTQAQGQTETQAQTRMLQYLPEVMLSYVYQEGDSSLEIKGRADGIMRNESGWWIEEIKSTTLDLDLIDEGYSTLHWAQAQCYAFMYANAEGLPDIGVQLTYVQLDNSQTKTFGKRFSLPELSNFFFSVVQKYLAWAMRLQNWKEARDASIRNLEFPFGTYRPGQRDLVVAVYKTIKEGQKLFVQAPTGIGKTMGTIFPALKALAEGLSQTIFYLTAKTITRTVAEKALGDLQERGLALKALTLTAKEKICFLPEAACDPEACSFARGYYDRLRPALEDVFNERSWTREVVEEFARKHELCPFEFSLELANWADVVICDYNYAFDPRVYLRRFFLEGGEYTFLVDEAHNLAERAREMFSAELNKEPWLKLKRSTKDFPALNKSIAKVNRALAKEKKGLGEMGTTGQQTYQVQPDENRVGRSIQDHEGDGVQPDEIRADGVWTGSLRGSGDDEYAEKALPGSLVYALRTFNKEAEKFLRVHAGEPLPWREELLDLYFQALSFVRTAEDYDEHYITCWESGADLRVRLFCLDPSRQLKEALGRARAAVLFSATLSPMEYFMEILGGEEHSYKLRLASPFPPENLKLMVHERISTKYKRRATTYHEVAEAIAAAVAGKTGNYLVFFPSYEYLQAVYLEFTRYNDYEEERSVDERDRNAPDAGVCYNKEGDRAREKVRAQAKAICQVPGMAEAEREDFLAQFTAEPDATLVGFALMGGIFGEGIDLIGERLSGAIIVGVGLPQIGLERELIRAYYQDRCHQGFEFAYMYPGFNKVLQAVGRVIRTETDRGVVLLIDERFARAAYRRLFPQEWGRVDYLRKTEDIKGIVQQFWAKS